MKISFKALVIAASVQVSIQIVALLLSSVSPAAICEAMFAPDSQKIADGEYYGDNGWKFIRVKVVRNANDGSIESVEVGNVKNTSPILPNAFQFLSKSTAAVAGPSTSSAIKTDRVEVVPASEFASGVGAVIVQAGGFRFRIDPAGRGEIHLTISVLSAGKDLPDAYLRRKI